MFGSALKLENLKLMVAKKGVQETDTHLRESLSEGHLKPSDFSLRDMAEAFMGEEWVRNLAPKSGRLPPLRESGNGDAVTFKTFSQLWGQVTFTSMMEAYNSPAFVFTQAVRRRSTDIMGRERVPGIARIGDEFTVVDENDDFPLVGVSPQWLDVGPKLKRGAIIPVSKEAVRSNAGPMILEMGRELGDWLGLNREKRIIDAIIDENGGATDIDQGGHRYHWNNTSYATFQATSPWVNIVTSNALADWTDLDNAWQRFINLTDPYTGEPIGILPTTLIVQPPGYHTALNALRAVEVRRNTNAAAGTVNVEQLSPSPIGGQYNILSSALLQARSSTDTDWWFGDPFRAVTYWSNWDIETEDRGPESDASFNRDILWQHKAAEKGHAQVMEPRALQENQA